MSNCHLLERNHIYHFRQIIPKDLRPLFPVKMIVRSLKTRDLKAAKLLAISIQGKIETTFALLRTGFLDEDLSRRLIDSLLHEEKKIHVTAPAPEPSTAKPKSPKLSKIIDFYIQERIPRWTLKSRMEYECMFGIMLRLLGDREIASYDRKTCVACRDTLLKLPPNYNKNKKYQGKTLAEVLAMKSFRPLHPITVNKYIVLLSSLFKWAVRQDYITRNPAEGLKMPVRRKASQEREAFSREDLQRIVDNLPYIPLLPERFWIPLIAMYSGMRLDEICQMTLDDVHEIDDILCFDINDDGDKILKTVASKRVVPVHPELLGLGFKEYLECQRKRKEKMLWSNLLKDKYGYWGSVFGKWYRHFNRKYVTKDPKKCFHSFRHTLADSLKQLDVQETLISEILGHANANITTGRYGKPYHPDRLLAALEKLDYGVVIPEYPISLWKSCEYPAPRIRRRGRHRKI